MQIFVTISAIITLTFAAGLNGSMTLTIAAILVRNWNVQWGWPLAGLSDSVIFGVLLPLSFVEIWFSKIPALARVNLYLQVVWRAIVACVLAGAVVQSKDYFLLVGVLPAIGAMIIQVIRVMVALVVRKTTFGIGSPVMSMIEDLIAVVSVFMAAIVPHFALAFVAASGYLLIKVYREMQRKSFMRDANALLPPTSVSAEPQLPDDDDK